MIILLFSCRESYHESYRYNRAMVVDREQVSLSLAQHAVRLQTLLDRRIVGVLHAHGLSRAELDVLGALVEFGENGVRARELSSRLLLTTGGLSNILRRLQADDLISREPDLADGRSQVIRLSTKGRSVAQETGTATVQVIRGALDAVDESVLEQCDQLLHTILLAIDEDSPVHRHRSGPAAHGV
jgi:DNA-binding MarR family transcriptional regulator